MICMCFHWLESFPYKQATVLAVDKGLLEGLFLPEEFPWNYVMITVPISLEKF